MAAQDAAPNESVNLPLARVKRIIKQDVDIHGVSTSAVYAVSAAARLFVRYMTEQALFEMRSTGKTRLTYTDFASSVARTQQLEFLKPVVPKTQPFHVIARKRAEADLGGGGGPAESVDEDVTMGEDPEGITEEAEVEEGVLENDGEADDIEEEQVGDVGERAFSQKSDSEAESD